jgi:hypothetical protein
MEITPDTKDWTWVLQRACPDCGLDTRAVAPTGVAGMVRENAAAWEAVLGGPDTRRRPAPQTWSPLEYACHVRDTMRIFDRRLLLMLTETDPLFPNWDQDATAVEDRYGDQDPAAVAAELRAAADTIADHFDRVQPDEWPRTGRRSDGAAFTIESFARYFIHDPVHHLHDVTSHRHP